MINVLLVDDHELVRTAIEYLLNSSPHIRVVGVAGTGEEALELLLQTRPAVVLMDISMPGIGGVEASKRIIQHHPHVKIIALSTHDDGPLPQQLLQMGVHGYLSKSCAAVEMVAAIHQVFEGNRYVSADVATNLVFGAMPGEETPFDRLSQREMEIIMQLLQGIRVPEIAENLLISTKTVNTYRYRIHQKLGLKNDVELTRLALKYKLIKDIAPGT